MKIAYLTALSPESAPGVTKKILSQVRHWKERGHTVQIYNVKPENSEYDQSLLGELRPSWHDYERQLGLSGIVQRINVWKRVTKKILDWEADIVYYRYDRYWPGLKRLAQQIPLIAEINTKEAEYYERSKKWYIYHKISKQFFFYFVSGVVCLSSEICTEYPGNIKKRTISNGIDLSEYRILPASNTPSPELVFIGDQKYWHGVDKILDLAKLKPEWKIHLIGYMDSKADLDNVIYHGRMNKREYERIFCRADIGIGSLALHRKKMTEASPLKVREYLAYGLPTIVGYRDTDIQNSIDYILQISNSEDNVHKNIADIESFVHRWKGQRISHNDLPDISYKTKEKMRLKFFKRIINE